MRQRQKKKKRKYQDERQEGDKIDWQLDFGHPENRRKDPYKPNKEAQTDKDFANKDEKAIFIIANYFVENMNQINNIIIEMEMLDWVGSPRREYAKHLSNNFFQSFGKIKEIFDSLSQNSLDYFFQDSERESDVQAAQIVQNYMKKLEKIISEAKVQYDKDYYGMAAKILSQNTAFFFQSIANRMDKNYLVHSGRQEQIVVKEYNQSDLDGEPDVKEVSPNDRPSWGHGWKTEDDSGNWEWYKTNWDSSD